jgi:hypothetical protein
MTHKVTVIVNEGDKRTELIFDDIIQATGIEFSKGTLTLWTEKGKLLNTRHVIPNVSHYCVEDELEW